MLYGVVSALAEENPALLNHGSSLRNVPKRLPVQKLILMTHRGWKAKLTSDLRGILNGKTLIFYPT